MSYAELAVTTNYSFLRGASHPGQFVERANALGYTAIGIADRNSLAGIVRAYDAWKRLKPGTPPRLLFGARLVFQDGTPDILVYPRDRAAYGRLCRLLSDGKSRAPKGECFLEFADFAKYREGLLAIVMPPPDVECARGVLMKFDAPVWLAASMLYTGEDRRRLKSLQKLALETGARLIAVNDALYHHADQRELQDVVTCIREHITLAAAGKRLQANAERYLKHPKEMARLFRAAPAAVAETLRFADGIRFPSIRSGRIIRMSRCPRARRRTGICAISPRPDSSGAIPKERLSRSRGLP